MPSAYRVSPAQNKGRKRLESIKQHITQAISINDEIEVSNLIQKAPWLLREKTLLSDLFSISRSKASQKFQIFFSELLIDSFPNFLGGYHSLALILIESKDLTKAKKILLDSLKFSSENLRTNLFLSEIAFEEKDYNQCIKLGCFLIKKYPTDSRGYIYLAKTYMAQNLVEQSIAVLLQGLNVCFDGERDKLVTKIANFGRFYIWDISKYKKLPNKNSFYAVFLASGGITHMLSCLGAVLKYCFHSGRKCLPVTQINPHFQLYFWDVFKEKNELAVSKSKSISIMDSFEKKYSISIDAIEIRPIKGPDGLNYYSYLEKDDNLNYDQTLCFPLQFF